MRVPKFLRRSSTVPGSAGTSNNPLLLGERIRSKASLSLPESRDQEVKHPAPAEKDLPEVPSTDRAQSTREPTVRTESNITENLQSTPNTSVESPRWLEKTYPLVTVQEPTPDLLGSDGPQLGVDSQSIKEHGREEVEGLVLGHAPKSDVPHRPQLPPRSQSLVPTSQTQLNKTLLQPDKSHPCRTGKIDYFTPPPTLDMRPNMRSRKIWVKRPGASATLVSINEEDLVDDVRDMILRKYANSLGRSFDAPDITLRIVGREHPSRQANAERTLGPEEPITRTLDAYYPGGQTVEEALVIDIPQRRTPRPSPRAGHPVSYYYQEDFRPGESGNDYFPPMPTAPSPHLPAGSMSLASGPPGAHHASSHSTSVINSSQLPPLPSPGSRSTRYTHRPKYGRQHTSSPTILTSASNMGIVGTSLTPCGTSGT